MSNFFIGRQPILDAKKSAFAYSINFNINPFQYVEDDTKNAEDITCIENNIGFSAISGNKISFIDLPSEVLSKIDFSKFKGMDKIAIDINSQVLTNINSLKKLKEIKEMGALISLNNYQNEFYFNKALYICDFIKIDYTNFDTIQLESIANNLIERNIKCIGKGVNNEDIFNILKSIGFYYFEGYFFTEPVYINGKQSTTEKRFVFELLAKFNKPNVRFDDLSLEISKDPILCHKLLSAINNSGQGIPIQITSIEQALRYMGIKRLTTWINTVLITEFRNLPKEQILTALIRARFCEQASFMFNLAEKKDQLYMMGLFSNLDAFFNLPLDQVLFNLPLCDSIRNALLHGQGEFKDVFYLLKSFESKHPPIDLIHKNSIPQMNNIYLHACSWAQKMLASL